MSSTQTDVIDGVSASAAIKVAVAAATTANITLSGEQTIDGVAIVDGDRVLVKDQTDDTENGIYNASTTAWSRAADFDGNRDVRKGTLVHVLAGIVNIKTMWRCTSADPIVIDEDSITFEQFMGTANQATTTVLGYLKTSTDAEAQAKTSLTVALTPSNLAALDSSETFSGLSERVSTSEATGGTDDVRYMTSLKTKAAAPNNMAAAVAAATAKTTPVAADVMSLYDSAASGVLKQSTIQQIITGLNILTNFNIQTFTAAGANTYTPTSGMKFCFVISTGGGGGGGGADTDGGSGSIGVGSGGGAGGTCISRYTAAQIGASQTVTIGAGGTAGSATNGTNGGNGGNTTFGALHTAGGGTGGTGSGVSSAANPETSGAAGGTGSSGTLNITGGYGEDAVGSSIDGTTDSVMGTSGSGGASFWGGGGSSVAVAQASLTTDMDIAGRDGQAYGSGGSGAVSLTSTTGAAGGAGKAGVCLVLEFI